MSEEGPLDITFTFDKELGRVIVIVTIEPAKAHEMFMLLRRAWIKLRDAMKA